MTLETDVAKVVDDGRKKLMWVVATSRVFIDVE
jgi:hypothetical protein